MLPKQVEIVSNMNSLRTGQLMGELEHANRQLAGMGSEFLQPRKPIVLVERNHDYLDELLAKVLPELCPSHCVSYQDHHLPHYVVHDGKVEVYKNLNLSSPVVLVRARVKHPCSVAEKVPRKTVYFGRVSERHDSQKLMIGDIIGLEVVTRYKEQVKPVARQILSMPFLKLEHEHRHDKENGYNSNHLNMTYENGNPEMRGLELEVQVTDLQSHLASMNDPKQGHDTSYGAEKLSSRHELNGQLVIFGNSVKIPRGVCEVKRAGRLLVAEIPNKIQPYLLVVPTEN
jgi:ppGpp synthetase/RelA/SpoT-type nucleotidyltranferase